MAHNYGYFTPRRQQALKRAAMISAAKRRGHISKKKLAAGVLSGAVIVGGVAASSYVKANAANQLLSAMANHPSQRGLGGVRIRTDADKFHHTAYTQRRDRLRLATSNPRPNLSGRRPNSHNYLRPVR
jgi:hypothetical protein